MQGRNEGIALDQLLDEVSDLIFLLGPGFRIEYINRAVERTLGCPPEALLGRRAQALLHPDDLGMVKQSLRAHPTPPGLSLQVRARTSQGDYRLLRLRVTLSWSDDGTFVRARVIAQDVTEQVALRQAHSSRAVHFSALMDLFQQEVVDAPPMHLLQSLLELAIETIPDAERGSVLLRKAGGFRFVASVGWPLDILQRIEMPSDDEHNELLRRSGIKVLRLTYDPQQLLDLGEPNELVEQLRAIGTYDIKVSLRAPILLDGELYGYFNLDNLKHPNAFDDLAQEAVILFAGQAAVSLKYQHLLDQLAAANEESNRQATRQSLLARIATIINSSLDIQDVFTTSLALIGEAIEVQKAGIVLFDWKHREGRLAAQWSSDGVVYPEPLLFPLTTPPELVWPLQEAAPIIISDTSESPYLENVREIIQFQDIRSMLLLPLVIQNEIWGVIGLSVTGEARHFSPDEIEFADTIRQQISVAVERARLYEQATQRANLLMALNDVMLEVSREMDIEAILKMIVGRATSLVEARGGIVFLKEQGNELVVAAASFPARVGSRVKGAPLVGEAVLQGETLMVEDYDSWAGRSTAGTGDLGPMIAIPLCQGEEVIGIISFSRRRGDPPFSQDDRWLLELFAQQATVALTRARMVDAMQRQLQDLLRLRSATLAISQQLDSRVLQRTLVEQACALLGCTGGFFFQGMPEQPLYTSPSLVGDGLQRPAREMAVRVARSQQPLVVHESDIGTVVGLPLCYGESVLGVLLLVGERELRTDQHFGYILNLFGTQAAIAFENARLYQQSEALKQFNENIIQWMDEGILMLDEHGVITFANRASEDLLGYAPGTLVGHRNLDLCHPDDLPLLKAQMHLRQAGQSSRYELRIQTTRGEAVPVIISAKPLFNLQGDFDKSLVVLTDISERKRLEQQLIQADKLSAVGRLVSGVAHELNNPLTSIIGYTQLISMSPMEEEVAHEVRRIQSEAKRAARIVKNLLAFARQHKPEKQLVDMNQLLQSTLDLRAYHLKLQGVTLVWELAEELPLTSADPYQLQQVIMNLVTNAEQAMAETTPTGTITIRTRLVSSEGTPAIQVIIADTGPGMDEATSAHIFDPFFTTKEVGRGTGLGLSICFGIVQEHGGHIEVQSERGKGSAFIVTLPVHRLLLEEVVSPEARPEASAPPASRKATILVIEDEPSVSMLVSQVLRLHGHQVTVASSAEEALPLLRGHRYDLVLSDLKMPGMGGQQLFKLLREEQPTQAERVIFMTGDTVSPDTHAFLTASGRPYLAKPFQLEELRARVEEALAPPPP